MFGMVFAVSMFGMVFAVSMFGMVFAVSMFRGMMVVAWFKPPLETQSKKPETSRNHKPKTSRNHKPKNLREPSSFRSGSGFTPGVDLGILVGILMIHSLLSGLLLWGFSGVLRMFRKVVSGKRRGRRYTVLPSSCGSYLRVRLRNRWVRVEVSQETLLRASEKRFLARFP